MKHPIWILNSALLFLLALGSIILLFSWHSTSEREDFEPEITTQPIKRSLPKISIEKLYENDLFGTYRIPVSAEHQMPEIIMPQVPAPMSAQVPERPPIQFLDPLAITLKGIMTFSVNDSKNRAIIEENKTGAERIYRVGDTIEDAQLLRIFSNKVVFIRSNGQQEVIYLRAKDALADPSYTSVHGWSDVVEQINENHFIVNPNTFIVRVQNLGQFIDMLDLTTVYRRGESAGCRIGNLEENSLGIALGLQVGDIILSINNIPATTTSHRFKIYKTLVSASGPATIKVYLKRNNRNFTIEYELKEIVKKDKVTERDEQRREQERLQILQNKQNFAPTMYDIRMREKNYMKTQGKKPTPSLSNQIE